MKSWKTTVLGIAGILSALCSVATSLLDGNTATNPDWTITVTAITTGFGLIFARDNGVSSEQAGAK